MTHSDHGKKIISAAMKRILREWIAKFGVRHLCGTKQMCLRDDEAAVTCLVKNGQYYIEAFIDHYLKMGFRHIFLLDNVSTDETVRLASRYASVSVYQTSLPVSKYQAILKKTIAQKTIAGGWCLDADIDEFFEYPCSDKIDLSGFLHYLNRNGYDAVITQMLDLFADKPLSSLCNFMQQEDVKSNYRMYDLSTIDSVDYLNADLSRQFAGQNQISNSDIKLLYGGIRKKLYGLNCLLTKHSLFSMRSRLRLFPHVHFVDNVKVADVSAVLRHYKLTQNAISLADQNRSSFTGTAKGYSDFINLIITKPDFRIADGCAKELTYIDQLIEDGFVVVSSKYRVFVDNFHAERS